MSGPGVPVTHLLYLHGFRSSPRSTKAQRLGAWMAARRPEVADLMLLATVTLWALNFTVTKYVISHGFEPVAYGVLRFGSAALLFGAFTWWRERSFALRGVGGGGK